MKLYGTIAVHVAGEDILRRAGLFDRMRRAFGGNPDLRTGNMRASLEASAVVDAVRAALGDVGANNAVSLVIDDLVLFQDRDRRGDDLGDLFLAFHEHSAAIGGDGFRLLRLAVEHEEAGLHLVLEVQARTEHAAGESAVRVIVSGRMQAFEPRAGETAEAYKRRVEPLMADTTAVAAARMSFESFVNRVRDAIARAMPEARAEMISADAQLVKVGETQPRRRGARATQAPGPNDPHYDPHEANYPNPMLGMLGMMMMGSMMTSMMMMGMAPMTVVDPSGAPVEPDPGADAGADGGDAGAEDFGGDPGGMEADAGGGDLFDSEW